MVLISVAGYVGFTSDCDDNGTKGLKPFAAESRGNRLLKLQNGTTKTKELRRALDSIHGLDLQSNSRQQPHDLAARVHAIVGRKDVVFGASLQRPYKLLLQPVRHPRGYEGLVIKIVRGSE